MTPNFVSISEPQLLAVFSYSCLKCSFSTCDCHMCIIIVYFDFILSSAGSKDTSLVNLAAAHAGKENLSFQLPLTCIHLIV